MAEKITSVTICPHNAKSSGEADDDVIQILRSYLK
jgi:hypothetical protein